MTWCGPQTVTFASIRYRFKDDVKLTASSRTMMEKNGNVYTLLMNHVVKQDEGQYTVRATNSEGTTDAMANLTVKGILLKHY